MTAREHSVREQIEAILRQRFGRCDEQLTASGILDSLRTIELALDLETTFKISLHQLTLQDTTTLTTLTKRLVELGAE